ncbi:MAG: hypothetical protein ACK559_19435, partial [bacterium]
AYLELKLLGRSCEPSTNVPPWRSIKASRVTTGGPGYHEHARSCQLLGPACRQMWSQGELATLGLVGPF